MKLHLKNQSGCFGQCPKPYSLQTLPWIFEEEILVSFSVSLNIHAYKCQKSAYISETTEHSTHFFIPHQPDVAHWQYSAVFLLSHEPALYKVKLQVSRCFKFPIQCIFAQGLCFLQWEGVSDTMLLLGSCLLTIS